MQHLIIFLVWSSCAGKANHCSIRQGNTCSLSSCPYVELLAAHPKKCRVIFLHCQIEPRVSAHSCFLPAWILLTYTYFSSFSGLNSNSLSFHCPCRRFGCCFFCSPSISCVVLQKRCSVLRSPFVLTDDPPC